MIPVKANSANLTALVDDLRIQTIPALVFYSPGGLYLQRLSGFIPADELENVLSEAGDRAKQLDETHAKLAKRAKDEPKNVQALSALALFYSRCYRDKEAGEFSRQALALDPPEPQKSHLRLSVAYYEIRGGRHKDAEPLIDQVTANPDLPRDLAAQAGYYKGLCLFYGKAAPEEARATWKKVIESQPRSTWAGLARKMLRNKFGE